MYRTIEASFWTDPKVKKLTANAKLFFLYLVTNTHSHVSGIYYLPAVTIAHELGLSERVLDTLCDTLSNVGLARFDKKLELVWVKNMFRYQGRGDKNERAAARHLSGLHKSVLVKEFLTFYPDVLRHFKGYPIDRVSGSGSNSHSEQEKEQEKEQEREQEQENSCSEPQEASEPDAVLMEFPLAAKGQFWTLRDSQVIRFTELFPGVDVLAQCRRALAWCEANPEKRKTANGMVKFLNRWLDREQNEVGGKGNGRNRPGLNFDGLQAFVENHRDAD